MIVTRCLYGLISAKIRLTYSHICDGNKANPIYRMLFFSTVKKLIRISWMLRLHYTNVFIQIKHKLANKIK